MKVQQFYKSYIKTLDEPIKWLLYISCIYLFLYMTLFIHVDEIFNGAKQIGDVLSNISVAVITGVLVYILTAYKPALQKEQEYQDYQIRQLKFLRSQLYAIISSSYPNILSLRNLQIIRITEQHISLINHELRSNEKSYLPFGLQAKIIYPNVQYIIKELNRIPQLNDDLFSLYVEIESSLKSLVEWYEFEIQKPQTEPFQFPGHSPVDLYDFAERIGYFIGDNH